MSQFARRIWAVEGGPTCPTNQSAHPSTWLMGQHLLHWLLSLSQYFLVFGKEKIVISEIRRCFTHWEKKRSTVQFNVLHDGFAKSSDLQLRKPKSKKKSLTSAISNVWKIHNSILVCNLNSWLAKKVVVTLVTLIWLSPVCCRCVTSNR